MTFQGDPHRTLGVAPGASLNEIKSAYRRLVKQYHPDAAGERALPRFLAIQQAYERLVDGEGRLRPPGGARRGTAPRPQEPWRADASRARASRDAWRASRASGTRSRRSPGAAGPEDAPADEPSAGDRGGRPGERRRAGEGATSDAGATGRRPHREHHARRGPRKATPGSTTYDEAAEPLDPEWDGGAWYGPSSGTYWTLNPKEYADPRKHGPEYQARARRANRAGTDLPGEDIGEGDSAAGDVGPPQDAPAPSPATGTVDDEARWRWTGPATSTAGDGTAWGTRAWRYDDSPRPEPGERRRGGTTRTARPAAEEDLPDLESIARRFAPRSLLALARRPDPRWRLLLAFTGWPPIGFAVGSLAAELTGCASFAATCPEPMPLLLLALQPLVVIALFLVAPVAAVAAFAAIAGLAAALPVAAVLSVGSLPESRAGAPVLSVVAAIAYFVALAIGATTAWRAAGDTGDDATAP